MSEGKACKKCLVWKGFWEFSFAHPGVLRSACNGCNALAAKQRRLDDPERSRSIWQKSHKKNLERNLARKKVYWEKARHQLSDAYVRRVIAGGQGVNSGGIPCGLIDLKREHLRLQRLVKEIKQAQPKEMK